MLHFLLTEFMWIIRLLIGGPEDGFDDVPVVVDHDLEVLRVKGSH